MAVLPDPTRLKNRIKTLRDVTIEANSRIRQALQKPVMKVLEEIVDSREYRQFTAEVADDKERSALIKQYIYDEARERFGLSQDSVDDRTLLPAEQRDWDVVAWDNKSWSDKVLSSRAELLSTDNLEEVEIRIKNVESTYLGIIKRIEGEVEMLREWAETHNQPLNLAPMRRKLVVPGAKNSLPVWVKASLAVGGGLIIIKILGK